MSGRWLVVAAMRAELPRGLGARTDVALSAIGRAGAVAALPAGTRGVIITGTCGALESSAPVGSLVAPARLVEPASPEGEGAFLQPDARLHAGVLTAAARLGLSVSVGTLVRSGAVVDAPRLRADLARSHGAAFVDMESTLLAAAAERQGLPWVVLRMVSDSPERPLSWLGDLLGGMPQAEPSPGRVALGLLRRPWHGPRLLGLWQALAGGRRDAGAVLAGLLDASPRGWP